MKKGKKESNVREGKSESNIISISSRIKGSPREKNPSETRTNSD